LDGGPKFSHGVKKQPKAHGVGCLPLKRVFYHFPLRARVHAGLNLGKGVLKFLPQFIQTFRGGFPPKWGGPKCAFLISGEKTRGGATPELAGQRNINYLWGGRGSGQSPAPNNIIFPPGGGGGEINRPLRGGVKTPHVVVEEPTGF